MSPRRVYRNCFFALFGLLTMASSPAMAEGAPTSSTTVPPAAEDQLSPVITHLRLWLAGLLGVGATLMLTVAGWLYMTAGGNPTQIEKAKTAFKSAMVGYALAALAPVLVGVLKGLVG